MPLVWVEYISLDENKNGIYLCFHVDLSSCALTDLFYRERTNISQHLSTVDLFLFLIYPL